MLKTASRLRKSTGFYDIAQKNKRKRILTVCAIGAFLFSGIIASVLSVRTTDTNAKTQSGGTVNLSRPYAHKYGDSDTGHYRVSRTEDGETIRNDAFCAQSTMSIPSLGNRSTEEIIVDPTQVGKWNTIKWLILAYKYNRSAVFQYVVDNSGSGVNHTYAAAHACISRAYSGTTDDFFGHSISGLNSACDHIINLARADTDLGVFIKRKYNSDGSLKKTGTQYPLESIRLFVIKTSGAQDVIFAEEPNAASIRVTKKDSDSGSIKQGDASLEGATFKFYDEDDDVVKDIEGDDVALKVGSNGKTPVSDEVFEVPGTYTAKETVVPAGYKKMPDKKISVSADDAGDVKNFTFTNDIIRNDVQLQKCDKDQPIVNGVCATDGSKQGDTSLQGIEFQIINRSANPVWVDPDGNDTVSTRAKCNVGAVCATITTNAAGFAATTNGALPYGTYELKESETNTYYLLTDTQSRTFKIRKEGAAGVSKFTATASGDYSTNGEGDVTGSMFIDEAVRGDVKIYKCDDELRAGSNGNATANASATRTCMPIGGADFSGIKVAIWNRSAKPSAIRGQQNNAQATRADGSKITGNYSCAPSTGYDVSKACLILTFDKSHIDGSGSNGGWYVQTSGKAFPVGHYEFREIDPEGRTNPQDFSNGKGYYLTDTQYTHKFSIDPTTNPSGWVQQPSASAEGQTTKANQDGQVKIFLPKTYTNGTNDAALFNKARRGDVHFQKKIEDCADPSLNGSALKFAPFLLISKTNGEAHVLITNKNGIAGTGMTPDLIDDDYIAQKYKFHTNQNDGVLGNQLTTASSDCAKAVAAIKTSSREDTAAARKANAKLVKAVQTACTITSANEATYLNDTHAQYRVWFGSDIRGNTAPVDNNRSGALPYDEYYLIELKTSKTDELKLQLASTSVNVEKNGQNVDLGTIDDVPECEEDCKIELKKRSDPASGTKVKRGDTITYFIDLKNVGKQDNEDYGVRDYIPTGTTYKQGSARIASTACEGSNTNGPTCKYNTSAPAGAAVDWQHLTIEAGQTLTLSFQVTVNKDAPQVIVNQAFGQNNWDGRNDPTDPTNEVFHYVPIEQGCVKIKKWSNPLPSTKVTEGQEIKYTLTMTNTCSTNRPYVQVRDYIPQGTTYKQGSVSNTDNAKGAFKSGSEPYVEWLLTNLAVGEERTTSFTVTVNQKHPVWIENTAFLDDFGGKNENPGNPGEIKSDPRTSETGTQSNTIIHYFDGSPEIPPYPFLEKGSDPAPGSIVNPGDVITYRLTYWNLGTKVVTSAGIRDVIPEGTTYVEGSASDHGYYNKNQNSVDWKNLRIEAGKSITVTFQVKVNGSVSNLDQAKSSSSHSAVKDCEGNTSTDGSGSGGNDGPRVITNQALYGFDWDGQDDPENKSNIVEHKKNVTHGYCLTVYKESNPVSGSQVGVPGNSAGLPSEITYTLPATNTGATTVPFTRIRDYIPEGTVYKEGSVSAGGVYNKEGNYVEWVIKDIAPATTNRSASYTVTVEKDATTGQAVLDHIYNTALYESGNEDPGKPGDPNLPDPGKETNKVVHWTKTPPPCLLNGIKDSTPVPGTEVHTGDIITYHLTLRNNGGQACTKAMIRDYIPDNTTYVEGSADNNGTYDQGTNAVYWENLKVEPAGGTITVNFQVQVNAGIGKTSIFNQFDYGEGNLDSTSNIVEHPAPLTPLAPKTGSERVSTLAVGFSGLTGIILAALYFTKRHFTRRSFRL